MLRIKKTISWRPELLLKIQEPPNISGYFDLTMCFSLYFQLNLNSIQLIYLNPIYLNFNSSSI
jgi:hypothetical protein